jgi:hypothetical protein
MQCINRYQLTLVLKYIRPRNIQIYQEAFIHKSAVRKLYSHRLLFPYCFFSFWILRILIQIKVNKATIKQLTSSHIFFSFSTTTYFYHHTFQIVLPRAILTIISLFILFNWFHGIQLTFIIYYIEYNILILFYWPYSS